jgi:two-component system, OmpR family, torCAD operon response regulator TorR
VVESLQDKYPRDSVYLITTIKGYLNVSFNKVTGNILIISWDTESTGQLRTHLQNTDLNLVDCHHLENLAQRISQQKINIVIIIAGPDTNSATEIALNIRRESRVGLMFISSKYSIQQKIALLESGIDEYFEISVHPREFLAKLKNFLRHAQPSSRVRQYQRHVRLADWHFDFNERRITDPLDQKQNLSRSESKLLQTMVDHRGEVLSRDHLMQSVWRRPWHPNDRSIDALVAQLRKKLAAFGEASPYIKTLHGTGYLFIAPTK